MNHGKLTEFETEEDKVSVAYLKTFVSTKGRVPKEVNPETA